jgi:tetratricopeptide (TPR) repeat protein
VCVARASTRRCRTCGTPLAHDNRAVHCTACGRRLAGPPAVPPEFWDYEGFREPLAAKHIGRLIRTYRHHPAHYRVLPQHLIGEWLGLTQAQLSRIENGPRTTDLTRLTAWASVLGVPPDRLWFAATGSRHGLHAREQSTTTSIRDNVEPATPTSAGGSDDVRRSEFLAVAGGTFAGLVAPSLMAGQRDKAAGPQKAERPAIALDDSAAGAVTTSADRLLGLFLQLEAEIGGDDLYEPMTRHVERLAKVVDHNPRPALLYRLGQLSQMTGWLALDGNRHGAARRYLTTAVHAANEADDPSLAASALAYMSLQATYCDKPKQAQALAMTAAQLGQKTPTPLVRTMLATRLARAHAKQGCRQESLAALDQAHAAYDQAGNVAEPLWISYVDEIEVNAQAGACYLDLGLHDQAETALVRAVELLRASRPERVRDHVHYLSRLAKCRLLAGDIEHACQTGMRALDLAMTVGSARVVERIAEFDAALRPATTSAARDFRERFALFTQSR